MPDLPQEPITPSSPNWRAAVVDLITARFELFQLEASDIVAHKVRNIVYLILGLGALFFAWIFLIIAAIPFLSAWLKQPWHYIVLGYAVIHLFFAILFLLLRKKAPSTTPFALTREELQRDREWIAHL